VFILRRAAERGIVDHGWLLARHTFSFASYLDPRWERFRSLRVINEDTVQPAQGFGAHPHRDMEIVTWILAGALEHEDSTGEHGVLRPGDVQVMTAGTGIVHSEFNHSPSETVHLLQTWIFPARRGAAPAYAQRHFPVAARTDRLCAIASGDAREDSLRIGQDACVFTSLLGAGRRLAHELDDRRGAWLQIARGRVQCGDQSLSTGDGLGISDVARIELSASEDAELLLFDLP